MKKNYYRLYYRRFRENSNKVRGVNVIFIENDSCPRPDKFRKSGNVYSSDTLSSLISEVISNRFGALNFFTIYYEDGRVVKIDNREGRPYSNYGDMYFSPF